MSNVGATSARQRYKALNQAIGVLATTDQSRASYLSDALCILSLMADETVNELIKDNANEEEDDND